MDKEHRISTGAIILQEGKILLVRYADALRGRSYLVGPGGRVENDESIIQAVVREVKEETGLDVNPDKILFVEDLISRRTRMVKIWLLCRPIGGQLAKTQGAVDEGIIEARWYRKEELKDEVVYPTILASTNWRIFLEDGWEAKHLESKDADADF
jgi:8-oxo-dGTP pyrophosphatase MutT (NUDIX family)